jgi:hypothetical protein
VIPVKRIRPPLLERCRGALPRAGLRGGCAGCCPGLGVGFGILPTQGGFYRGALSFAITVVRSRPAQAARCFPAIRPSLPRGASQAAPLSPRWFRDGEDFSRPVIRERWLGDRNDGKSTGRRANHRASRTAQGIRTGPDPGAIGEDNCSAELQVVGVKSAYRAHEY